MTDQELKDLLAKFAAENAAGFAALRESMRESQIRNDRELASLSASARESQIRSDRELASLSASARESQIKSDRELASLSQNLKDTRGEVYGVGKSQGLVAEEFFYNSLLDKPTIGGVKYDQVNMNMQGGKQSNRFECDLAMINGKSVALIEVKYNVKEEAVAQVEAHIRRFKKFFPYYAKHTLYGGIAGFHIPKEVSKLALEKGLFVLKRRGDAFTVDAKGMQGF